MKSKRILSAFLAGLMAVSSVSAMAEDIIIVDDELAQEQTDTYSDDSFISEDIIITDEQTPAEDEMISEEIQPEQEEEAVEEIAPAEDEPEIDMMTAKEASEIIASGKCGENLTWKLNEKGTLTISGTGEMGNYDESPWYDWVESIKKVTIQSGVTSIGDYAFDNCYKLTSIKLPDSLTSIGEWAFYACYSLTSIEIPNGVTGIGEGTFWSCKSLTSVKIPDGVERISDATFLNCSSLSTITIPENVSRIGFRAFDECTSLTTVKMGNGVKEIGRYAFDGCTKLKNLTLSNKLKNISPYAFFGCESLNVLAIPNGVKTIEDNAFSYCTNLHNISLPKTLESIGKNAFSNCVYIKEIKYRGTKDEWIKIDLVEKNNDEFEAAGVTCSDGILLAYGKCGADVNWQMDENYVVSVSREEMNEGYGVMSGEMKPFSPQRMQKIVKENAAKLSFVIEEGITVIDGFTIGSKYIEIRDSDDLKKIGDMVLDGNQKDNKNKGDIYFTGTKEKWEQLIADNKYRKTYEDYYNVYFGEKTVRLTGENVTLSKTKFTYNSQVQNPSVTVKVGKKTLTQDKDYVVILSKKKSAGKAEISVRGLGKYYGYVTKEFSIVPKKTELTGVTAGTKSFTAKWNKQTTQTTGYELQYAKNKDFKDYKSKQISGNTKVSCKISKLESGKNYYVRIRTYKKEEGSETRYCSKWSEVMKVKTK